MNPLLKVCVTFFYSCFSFNSRDRTTSLPFNRRAVNARSLKESGYGVPPGERHELPADGQPGLADGHAPAYGVQNRIPGQTLCAPTEQRWAVAQNWPKPDARTVLMLTLRAMESIY